MRKFILACLIATGGLRAVSAVDAIHFVNPDMQLGNVGANQEISLTLVLTNGTEQTVKIVSADPSCRCTTVSNSPAEIAAHKVGNFDLIFSSARSTGTVVRTLLVELDGGQIVSGQFTANVLDLPSREGGGKPAKHTMARTNFNQPSASPVKGGIIQNLKPANNNSQSAGKGK